MESAESKAARYGREIVTDLPVAQAAERQERLDLRTRRDGGRRSRYMSVPELPWKRGA